MAAAFDPTELRNLLECGICLNRFQDPRVLPCLHSYCLGCLESHILSSKDQDGAFNCPQCREKCLLPAEGADKFPKNFFANTMKDVLPESILQESTQEGAESSGPTMCKHHDQESDDEHGEAVTFCVQCDAHYCQLCTKNHGRFAKDHKVTPVGDTRGIETELSANCKLHQSFPINWYCQSCSVPVCAECLAENHKNYKSEKLGNVEAALKFDMLDVSKMAAKRIKVLQNISSSIKADETKMEGDLDKASKDISDTADSFCKLIRQHENTLQDQLKQAREKAKKQFEKVEEELQTAKDNAMTLKAKAQSLHQAPSEQALCTVLQAQVTKQQYLHQQDTAVSSVKWTLERQSSQPGKPKGFSSLGSVDCKTMSQRSSRVFETEDISLGSSLHITKLDYKGKMAICSVTPIYKSMICVAHFGEKDIWVYSDDGKRRQKLDIPGIKKITGMVAVDDKTGELAVVGGDEPKIHFVRLSEDLTGIKHVTKELSITPYRISLDPQRHIVVSSQDNGKVIVLDLDGQVTVDIKAPVPHTPLNLVGIQYTKLGFIFSDIENKKVYFCNQSGHILRTSTDCTRPWHVAQTSWGHILVADGTSDSITVFSEAGDLLGRAKGSVNPFKYPYFLHINEADKVLYVGCGPTGEQEVRRYKFGPGDLPPLPVTHNICDISANIQLNTI